ncbi:class I SAM-dependent methyltransferase [Thermogemmatispora carboxidivorans]|uniref:class I SAM-dependent methyltransferase n=1 Tax=Thermogemmatispora carboxidivorans TaxID=1382306 RepID=UPI00069B27F5|nr:class I SAM-dependent methyltransferase [Thermogemmatispora carboxidivorans]
MPWWFFRRRSRPAASQTAPAAASGWQLGEVALPRLHGSRRYLQEQPYLLPKDLGEVNRLDFQHYILRAVLRGNYLAPIQQPRRILDVGCGTGQWAFELAQQFPQAQVVGLDLEQVKAATSPPPNYRFVQGDVLKGLPFDSDHFDFVHQRLLWLAIPLQAWPDLVRELARVTAPSGWVELVEFGTGTTDFAPTGPATERYLHLAGQLAALRGLDTEGVIMRSLDRYLRDAGLTRVEYQFFEVPLGQWGGRLGSLLALDFRESSKGLSGAIAAHLQIPEQEVLDLIESAASEFDEFHTRYRLAVAYGSKPPTTH